jgi:hypothetical protein
VAELEVESTRLSPCALREGSPREARRGRVPPRRARSRI